MSQQDPSSARSPEWARENCYTLARQEVRRLERELTDRGGTEPTPVMRAIHTWRHVQRICEEAGAAPPGVPRTKSAEAAPPAGGPQADAEICICAAVITAEGLMFRGHRHSDAMHAAQQAFCRPLRTENAQGFITSRGRFVDRQEGRQLQEAADIGSKAPSGYRSNLLFSEDLY